MDLSIKHSPISFKIFATAFSGQLNEFVKSLGSKSPMWYFNRAAILVVLLAVVCMLLKLLQSVTSVQKEQTTPSGETGMKFTKSMVGRTIRVQWSGSKQTPTLEGIITAVLSDTEIRVKYEDDFEETIDSKAHRIELISRKNAMANNILRRLSPKKSKKN